MKNLKNKFSSKSNNLEEFYIKNGYLLIKSPVNKKLLDKISKSFQVQFKKLKKNKDIHLICNKIMEDFENSNLYQELIFDKELINLMIRMIGKDLCVLNYSALWINTPTNKNPVLKKNDHVDAWTGTGVDTVFVKVFLTDCDDFNGMSVYPGTHLHGLYPVKNRSLNLPHNISLPKKINLSNAKKGDILIWHPLLVHATTGQSKNKTRISMTLRYKSTEGDFTSQEKALGYKTISVGLNNIIKRYIGNDYLSPFRVYGGAAAIDKRLSKVYNKKYFQKFLK